MFTSLLWLALKLYGCLLAMICVMAPTMAASSHDDDREIAGKLATFLAWHVTVPIYTSSWLWLRLRDAGHALKVFLTAMAEDDDAGSAGPHEWRG